MDLQRCLRNAAGCERMARLCDDPKERALWARVAMDWLKMAKKPTPYTAAGATFLPDDGKQGPGIRARPMGKR